MMDDIEDMWIHMSDTHKGKTPTGKIIYTKHFYQLAESMELTCPLCKVPTSADTKHHLYHECPNTGQQRHNLHNDITIKLAPYLGYAQAGTAAKHMFTRLLRRKDRCKSRNQDCKGKCW
jgi:hypothetical protein